MEIDHQLKKLPPRETLNRGCAGFGPLFGVPSLVVGGLLLALAFGPAELRDELRNPPVGLLAVPGALIAGLGVRFLGAGSRERKRKRRVAVARQASPGSPWEWDHPWNREGSRSAAKRWAAKSLVFVVLGGMFLTPFNYWAFVAAGPWLVKILVGLFDLLLLLALFGTGLAFLSYVRHGDPFLRFEGFPFRLGEELKVRMDRPNRIPAGTSLACTLRCIEERVEETVERIYEDGEYKTSRSTRTVCYQLWSATQSRARDGHEPYLELCFPLPPDRELTTRLRDSPPVYWELEVRGETTSPGYHATFLLPVY